MILVLCHMYVLENVPREIVRVLHHCVLTDRYYFRRVASSTKWNASTSGFEPRLPVFSGLILSLNINSFFGVYLVTATAAMRRPSSIKATQPAFASLRPRFYLKKYKFIISGEDDRCIVLNTQLFTAYIVKRDTFFELTNGTRKHSRISSLRFFRYSVRTQNH